jgi:2-hydroxychromene-2-carboxylate isomerase
VPPHEELSVTPRPATTPVEFSFDPGCPFTWRTSRWLTEVEEAGAAEVTWRLMSLGMLNEGNEVPEQYQQAMRQGARALRALAAAQAQGGSAAVARLYTALGTRRHEEAARATTPPSLRPWPRPGLPESVAAAVDDEGLDAAVRAEHEASQAAVGDTAGSPVTALRGRGYFGPVVVPVPTGDDALEMFEAVRLLAGVPAFSELKTARGPL